MLDGALKNTTVNEALEGLLRNAPAEAVAGIHHEELLRLLEDGPSSDRERWTVVSVLRGYKASVRLWTLVNAGALSAPRLHQVVTGLVERGHLGRAIPVRFDGSEWTEFAASLVDAAIAKEFVVRAPRLRQERRPRDQAKNALTSADRTRRYEKAQREGGHIRKTLWLTAEAASALDELVKLGGSGATSGKVVSEAIMATYELSRNPV